MIRFFRHSYLQQLIAIVLLVFVLWLPSFFYPSSAADFLNPATPLYNVFARLLAFSPTLMNDDNKELAATLFSHLVKKYNFILPDLGDFHSEAYIATHADR